MRTNNAAAVWASGDRYEPYVGRWSRLVAARFLDWLGPPPRQRWVDVGCGTGAMTAAILDRCDPAAVVGIDPSKGYIEYAAAHVTDPRVRFTVGTATDLVPGQADVVVSGLVLNFIPDPASAVAAMRASAAGGTVAAYVWDYAEGMQLMRYFWDAAAALDPEAAELDEGVRFPLCRPGPLTELWRAVGLVDVQTTSIEVPTVFRDFDDYWNPFLGGQAPAPGYAMSLDDQARTRLRKHLRARLPAGDDGSIALTARAWAIRGRAPMNGTASPLPRDGSVRPR